MNELIRSGGIVALLPYLAVGAWVVTALVVAIVRRTRRRPYRPPATPGETEAIREWRRKR